MGVRCARALFPRHKREKGSGLAAHRPLELSSDYQTAPRFGVAKNPGTPHLPHLMVPCREKRNPDNKGGDA